MNWRFFGLIFIWALVSPLIQHWLGLTTQPGFASYAAGALSTVTFVLGGYAYAWARGFLK